MCLNTNGIFRLFLRPRLGDHERSGNIDLGPLTLIFRDMLEKILVVPFQFGICFDPTKQSMVELFPPLVKAEMLPDNVSFQPFAWHGFDQFPMLGILLYVCVNLGVDAFIFPEFNRLFDWAV